MLLSSVYARVLVALALLRICCWCRWCCSAAGSYALPACRSAAQADAAKVRAPRWPVYLLVFAKLAYCAGASSRGQSPATVDRNCPAAPAPRCCSQLFIATRCRLPVQGRTSTPSLAGTTYLTKGWIGTHGPVMVTLRYGISPPGHRRHSRRWSVRAMRRHCSARCQGAGQDKRQYRLKTGSSSTDPPAEHLRHHPAGDHRRKLRVEAAARQSLPVA